MRVNPKQRVDYHQPSFVRWFFRSPYDIYANSDSRVCFEIVQIDYIIQIRRINQKNIG